MLPACSPLCECCTHCISFLTLDFFWLHCNSFVCLGIGVIGSIWQHACGQIHATQSTSLLMLKSRVCLRASFPRYELYFPATCLCISGTALCSNHHAVWVHVLVLVALTVAGGRLNYL
ncbi:hypothetical protein COO60DRAFT_1522480 [Scenedesmus sp. NREL 46B-D3]|nr:hypothetical protein COO60DRAFT_1522480 [Scenedesmus sp. NREL 46B-D3]